MSKLLDVINKNERLVIGLMSGTSVDGIDAVLCHIKGAYTNTKLSIIAFENYPFPIGIRERVFKLFEHETSSSKDICHMNALLGEVFADCAIKIAKKAGVSINEVDLIGSHGQTIYHIPEASTDCGYTIRSSLQIGEGAVIADRTGVLTVSDFRVADLAAGGLGAPLVPYTEYLLFRSNTESVALQNIGGVGNVTILPAGCTESDIVAFDTGPGNMVIDKAVSILTNGTLTFDNSGEMAAKGRYNNEIVNALLEDVYFKEPPPKTTGREYFGKRYTEHFLSICSAAKMDCYDIVSTATEFTARTIAQSINTFSPCKPDKLIIGGGGSYNKTLVKRIDELLPYTMVLTGEQVGYNSDAKEAVAFALLANETINLNANNIPSATGALRKKILGKINL